MAKILFLENEEDLIENLPPVRKLKGLEIIPFDSIPEALDQLAQEHFDAVLLDVMMPPSEDMDAEKLDYGRMTGVEVARRIKSINQEIPIIAFTVLTDSEILDNIRKAGVVKIIHKPSEPDQIAETIWQVLKSRK
jgi:CheY-like chemotaxis protein